MQDKCVNCDKYFEKCKKDKYARKPSLDTKLRNVGTTQLTIISNISKTHVTLSPAGKLICQECTALFGKVQSSHVKFEESWEAFQKIGKNTNTYIKRKLRRTPNKTPSKSGTPIAKRFKKQSPSKQKLHSRPTRTTWLAAFAKKHYQQGFNILWRKCNASVKAAFLRFITRTVCQEMEKLLLKRNNSILRTDTSPNSLHELTFQKLQEEMVTHTPVLQSALIGASTNVHGQKSVMYKTRDVKPSIMAAMAMFGYARKPKICKCY